MVHRPYYSDVVVNDYTKGVDVTVQDVSATDEYLVVNKSKEATVYIDAIDVKQNKYDAANKYIDRMTYALKKDIDGNFLKEVLNAEFKVSDGDFGGTDGNPITVSVSNAFQVFTKTEAKMNANDIEDTKAWLFVITPDVKAAIQQTNLVN
jgi:predicted 3-demethylubiquinone-9 3-methyltransferase (glyoxalase superfamily)